MKKHIVVAAVIVISTSYAQASELSAKKRMSESEMDKVAAGSYIYRAGDATRTPVTLPQGWQQSSHKIGDMIYIGGAKYIVNTTWSGRRMGVGLPMR